MDVEKVNKVLKQIQKEQLTLGELFEVKHILERIYIQESAIDAIKREKLQHKNPVTVTVEPDE